MRTELLGFASGDSGRLMVMDPCYLGNWQGGDYWDDGSFDKVENAPNDYLRACLVTDCHPNQGGPIAVDDFRAGVAFTTGLGDGSYPIVAWIDDLERWGERVLRVEIIFLPLDEEDDAWSDRDCPAYNEAQMAIINEALPKWKRQHAEWKARVQARPRAN